MKIKILAFFVTAVVVAAAAAASLCACTSTGTGAGETGTGTGVEVGAGAGVGAGAAGAGAGAAGAGAGAETEKGETANEGVQEVIPPNSKNFIGSWHPVPECGQCHVSLLSEKALQSKLGSCKCHDKDYTTGGVVDREKIRRLAHGEKTCVDCHIGSGTVARAAGTTGTADESAGAGAEIPCDEIHRVHLSVECQACHGGEKEKKPTIPKTANCNSCHLGDAHSIHGDKIGSLCVACHGSFGLKYKEEGYKMKEGVLVPARVGREEEEKYPTILNILKSLKACILTGKGEGEGEVEVKGEGEVKGAGE